MVVERHDEGLQPYHHQRGRVPALMRAGAATAKSVPMVFIACATAPQNNRFERSPRIFHVSRGSPWRLAGTYRSLRIHNTSLIALT
jgi:hypothetical protein